MIAFEVSDLMNRRAAQAVKYLEFVRETDLSMGLYTLPAGGADLQQPHTEDEIYYVVHGRARITVGDEDRAVEPGSIVYVPANVPHRFHGITQELSVLVVFGPAEYSRR
jgi:mannose-6-phosphate isomerase-like protein (cupin superfamily)